MPYTAPVTLRGDVVELSPLSPDDHDDLVTAASDGALWELFYTSVPRPEQMAAAIEQRLAWHAEGHMLPFTVRRTSGEAVGMTTYCHVDEPNRRLEIGYTWYAASAQRTGVNAEAKLLLLGHAFETLGCNAVELRTHRLNNVSRRAIERLGAQQDGILRSHQVMRDGSVRDTVVYSVLAHEWPSVRNGLSQRLSRPRA
jgi:RimJ/RimL family protein N-acetyltransferase